MGTLTLDLNITQPIGFVRHGAEFHSFAELYDQRKLILSLQPEL